MRSLLPSLVECTVASGRHSSARVRRHSKRKRSWPSQLRHSPPSNPFTVHMVARGIARMVGTAYIRVCSWVLSLGSTWPFDTFVEQ
jgi:hypothetical protein